jgi:hypothetical protein
LAPVGDVFDRAARPSPVVAGLVFGGYKAGSEVIEAKRILRFAQDDIA